MSDVLHIITMQEINTYLRESQEVPIDGGVGMSACFHASTKYRVTVC